jgi:HlyD family secretion protein
MKIFKITITSTLILLLILFMVYKSKDVNSRQDSKKSNKPKTIPVTIVKPKNGYFSDSITVSGIVLPKDEVQITPKATGKLTDLFVEEGSVVNKGQIIGNIEHYELDKQIIQSESKVKIAQANLNLAINGPLNPEVKKAEFSIKQFQENLKEMEINKKAIQVDFNNYQELYNKGLITKQQLNITKTQIEVTEQKIKSIKQQIESLNQSLKLVNIGTRPEEIEEKKAQLELTLSEVNVYKSQLDNYKINAPLNGVITRKFLSIGSLVNQNTPIVTLTTTLEPEIILNIPENQVEDIKINQKVDIKTSNESKNYYKAKIISIYPNIDSLTRLGKAKAKIMSKNDLKLGMTLICNIYTVEKNKTLTLPTDSIIKDNKEIFVYTVEKDKAIKKNIVLGIEGPDTTEVLSGISANDSVILSGNTFVKPGSMIDIRPELKIKR